jgi:hypothetical protein
LADFRARLIDLAGDDPFLLFAYRRKIAKELVYDERGKPMFRKVLKACKMGEQEGSARSARNRSQRKTPYLIDLTRVTGYTLENTRLICAGCDLKIQAERRFR